MLARGELQTIGATTLDEYLKAPGEGRRTRAPLPADPGRRAVAAHTIEILKGLRDRYEAHHRVSITDSALVGGGAARRPLHQRPLPARQGDRPIDEAGSRMRIRRMTAPPDLREFDERIAGVRREKESAIDAQDFEKAALRDRQKQLLADKARCEREWKAGDMDIVAEVNEELIVEVLAVDRYPRVPAHRRGVPWLLRMEEELHKRVIGQEQAIPALSQAIRRTRAAADGRERSRGRGFNLLPVIVPA